MKQLFIILRNKEPLKNGDINNEYNDAYEETGEELMRLIRDEIMGIWENKEDANSYAEYLQNSFPEDNISVGELHLIYSSVEWN